MNTVIIAEKPSQARAYAEAFNVKNKSKTHIELEPCSTFKNGALITWAIGHLITLKKPQETKEQVNTWDLNNLPYLPETYELKIAKDKTQHFNSVKNLLKQADLIINGCDIDREGSNIFYLILEYARITNKNIKRLWINSLEVDEVRQGFNNLRDNSKDYLMFQEAKARMVSDYLIGMNLSPLYTLKMQEYGEVSATFSIGRVQTPTLFMIYQRQNEIDHFESEPFHEIHGQFYKNEFEYKGKMKLREKEKSAVLDKLKSIENVKQGTIKSVRKEKKKQLAPKLHSLSTLQTTANKKWKYSPNKTLDAIQKLYDKKMVTYPRTDTQYITENEFNYLKENINRYLSLYDLNHDMDYPNPRKRFVDGSQVQEHYALVLTKSVSKSQIEGLDAIQANIFKEIYNTTLAMFLPYYEYETTEVITSIKECDFYSQGKIDVKLGWKELFSEDPIKEEDNKLPNLQEGDVVEAKAKLHEGMTQPPKLYTEGQLINLMKSCGKLINDEEDNAILKEVEGIGTEATRASIIDTLKKREYINVVKNKVNITTKGQLLCKAVAGTLLSSPEMTAKWEKALKNIPEKKMNFDTFISNTSKYINHQINVLDKELKENDISNYIKSVQDDKPLNTSKKNSHKDLGDCPKCQKSQVKKIKSKKGTVFYACGNSDCKFVIFESMAGTKLSQEIIAELITNRKTKNKVKGFKSKKGSEFSAYIELNDDYRTQFKF